MRKVLRITTFDQMNLPQHYMPDDKLFYPCNPNKHDIYNFSDSEISFDESCTNTEQSKSSIKKEPFYKENSKKLDVKPEESAIPNENTKMPINHVNPTRNIHQTRPLMIDPKVEIKLNDRTMGLNEDSTPGLTFTN